MGDMRHYGSVYNIGHKAITTIFDGNVTIEEKIDGSQFSFGVVNGVLLFRSKDNEIYLTGEGDKSTQKMFDLGVATALRLYRAGKLPEGYMNYGEYLSKPKHNVLVYSRVPDNNIIIFDVDRGEQDFMTHKEKEVYAAGLDLECVPLLFEGHIDNFPDLIKLLDTQSILGGTTIEGFVVKNYNQFTPDKKYFKGKYVSEKFKEKHGTEWKVNKQAHLDIVTSIVTSLRTEARWLKAIQHLRDSGELEGTPKDIGPLLKELAIDLEKEEIDQIKDILYAHFRKSIVSGVSRGFPEFYKQELAKGVFNG